MKINFTSAKTTLLFGALLQTAFATAALPQKADWTIESTFRYWSSEGGTKWAFTNGSPIYGKPTSMLNWRDVEMQSGEIVLNFISSDGPLINVEIGAGKQNGTGNITDDDYLSDEVADFNDGPTRFSHTHSKVDNGTMKSLRLGIGARLHPAIPHLTYIDLTSGISHHREKYDAYGDYQLEDPYGVSGTGLLVPYNVKVLSMDVWYTAWDLLRANSRWSLIGNLHLDAEGIIQPFGYMGSLDDHKLRSDITDDTKLRSRGCGWRGRIGLGYTIADKIDIGAGYQAEAFFSQKTGKAVSYFGGYRDTYTLNWEKYQRGGWYASASYKF